MGSPLARRGRGGFNFLLGLGFDVSPGGGQGAFGRGNRQALARRGGGQADSLGTLSFAPKKKKKKKKNKKHKKFKKKKKKKKLGRAVLTQKWLRGRERGGSAKTFLLVHGFFGIRQPGAGASPTLLNPGPQKKKQTSRLAPVFGVSEF